MAPRVRIDSGWSGLVFHVLAHVDLHKMAPDLFAPHYVSWVAAQPALAGERTLAKDAAVLARVLATPEAAIPVQAMAVLFENLECARANAPRELDALAAGDVASPAALRSLLPVSPAAELLRCAAVLEAPWYAALPEARCDGPQLVELVARLERMAACAPRLADAEVVLCRALTRHGRVFGERLYLGVPDPALAVSVEQVAMQAAHEASVLELNSAARARSFRLGERMLEAAAVAVFALRCARLGLSEQHRVWAEQWGVRPEHCTLAGVPNAARVLAMEVLRR